MFVDSQTLLELLLPELGNTDRLGLDIETRGYNARESEILTIQFRTHTNTHVLDVRKVNPLPIFDVLNNTKPLIIGHSLKYDLAFLREKYDFRPTRLFDTMLAFGIINNGRENPLVSLQSLARDYLGRELHKDIRDSFKYTYGALTQEQIEYAGNDVDVLPSIFEIQNKQLQNENLVKVAKLEFSILPVIVDMELTGIKVDKDKWLDVAKMSATKAAECELELDRMLGNEPITVTQESFFDAPKVDTRFGINPRSNKQILDIFNNRFKIPIPNTKEPTLSIIDHPFARLLLEYRAWHKQASTYGAKFIEKHLQTDGRIHSQFNQLGAASGRFSCDSPNLQNIPIRRTEEYRACFVAGDDRLLITADFDQIELKCAAVLSNEMVMIDEYNKSNPDLHQLTASKLFDTDEVTDAMRRTGKNANFSVLYQISPLGFVARYGGTEAEARTIISGFWKTYPMLHKYINAQGSFGLVNAYTATVIGRKRYFEIPPMNSSKYNSEISAIRREAANHSVQGSAAEIIKTAIFNMYSELQGYDAHIVNMVHDELVVETPKDNLCFVIPIISNNMEMAGKEIMGDKLRWTASLAFGKTWKKS